MGIRLTIGLTVYKNFDEAWFTIQALRMYHDLNGCEILVVDNFGDVDLEKFIKAQGAGIVRYEKCLGNIGPSGAKNKVFELAHGEMVLCIDSHVLLKPGALNIPVTEDLLYGPLAYNDNINYVCEWLPTFRGNMWGVWGKNLTFNQIPKNPFSIWGSGGGCFATKRSSWLGFNPRYRGFGGEEGVIAEKYRKFGRKVLCLPSMIWMHKFERKVVPYPLNLIDRVVNYILGFDELGLNKTEMEAHFGPALIKQAKDIIAAEDKKIEEAKKQVIETPVNIVIPKKVDESKLISALCITYGKPHLLEESIESFLRQDYKNKELIILNDLADQTLVFDHPQVKVFNYKERFKTLGEKRNECVRLSKGDILVGWDDDDVSLPWRFSQIISAFNENKNLQYYKPDKAWCYYGEELKPPHYNMFYMMAAFTRKAFYDVGQYKPISFGEDTELCLGILGKFGSNTKTAIMKNEEYPFIYGWRYDSYHISGYGKDEKSLEKSDTYVRERTIEPLVVLKPRWRCDYLKITRDALNNKK
jgi:glycosyltransferase involved in cell wall biosynthesis